MFCCHGRIVTSRFPPPHLCVKLNALALMCLGIIKKHLVYFMETSTCIHCGMWSLEPPAVKAPLPDIFPLDIRCSGWDGRNHSIFWHNHSWARCALKLREHFEMLAGESLISRLVNHDDKEPAVCSAGVCCSRTSSSLPEHSERKLLSSFLGDATNRAVSL